MLTGEIRGAPVPPRKLADHLLSVGRPHVRLSEAAQLMGTDERAASRALSRLRAEHQFFAPHPGLYFPVAPQYRRWGVPPATDFIDAYMRALNRAYYVALLSAAELHGAAHQRPQTFQVLVDRHCRDRDFDRVRLRFYVRANAASAPTVQRAAATGMFRMSTPEVTMLDLADRPRDCGGLNNVATLLYELAEETPINPERLSKAARLVPKAAVRRLGWLLDTIAAPVDPAGFAALTEVIAQTSGRPGALLDQTGPRRGRTDARWGLVINTDIEPDL